MYLLLAIANNALKTGVMRNTLNMIFGHFSASLLSNVLSKRE